MYKSNLQSGLPLLSYNFTSANVAVGVHRLYDIRSLGLFSMAGRTDWVNLNSLGQGHYRREVSNFPEFTTLRK